MSIFRNLLVSSSALAIIACGDGTFLALQDLTPPPVTVAPLASFTATVEAGTVPLEVMFSDTSSPGTAAITTYLWNFGDGTTSTEANPTHVYLVAGDFDVQLTVTTSVGSDGELAADFIDVDPSETAVAPTAVTAFDIDGDVVEAASTQVLIFLDEDVTVEQQDAVLSSAIDLGAGLQAFDTDFRMVQLFAPAGEELRIVAGLDGLDGVMAASLNFVVSEDRVPQDENKPGYARWLLENPITTWVKDRIAFAPKVTIDSDFTGGYWVDQIGLEAGLTALEDVELVENTIGIVDSGIPAMQDVISESRLSRFNFEGDVITDDDTFGTATGQTRHGRDVTAYAAGDAGETIGVNKTSQVVSVDVSSFERTVTVPGDDGGTETRVETFRTDINAGIRTAIDNGASVVNLSYGDKSRCSSSQATRLARRQSFRSTTSAAVNYARRNDVNLVFSAGNNCEKQDDQLLTDAVSLDNDSWESHALIVAASDASRNDACFTRMGGVVDLAAPGEQVAYREGSVGSGTSFSAPIVTGSLGLIRSINATLSAPEARTIIKTTVSNNFVSLPIADHQMDTNCRDRDTGDLNFPSDTTRGTTPTGILNFASAVETALLAKDVDLTSLDEISLDRGATQTVAVEVTLPEDGVAALDLVFLIDRSGSYGDDIDTLQAQAESIIATLGEKDISIQYAVASFSDFNQSPFGGPEDNPFELLQALTADNTAVIDAIDRLDQPLQFGADGPESQYEALSQVASGGVSFREGALPVILFATDADFHDSDVNPAYPGAGRTETLNALETANITVFGLQSGGSSQAAARITEVADRTNGSVFALDSSSSDVANAISDAVDSALQQADISLDLLAGDDWVTSITPLVHEDVNAGDTVVFDVAYTGLRNGSAAADLTYDIYFWARADEEALIARIKQSIAAKSGS